MNPLVTEIKSRYTKGDISMKLIFVNVGIHLSILISAIVIALFSNFEMLEIHEDISSFLILPVNDSANLLFKPHTLITHMFMHGGIGHLLLNMVMLYFMGKLFLSYFTSKNLFGLYLLGGLVGAIILLTIATISPKMQYTSSASGASAAIMAITIAVCAYAPKSEVRLFGIYAVKLMWIGVVVVFMDIIDLLDENTGGHIAHLGGAATGYFFATSKKKGIDITAGINRIIDKISVFFKRDPKMKVVHSQEKVRKMSDEEYNSSKQTSQKEIDKILDKISASGYDSLSKTEKEMLFKYSSK